MRLKLIGLASALLAVVAFGVIFSQADAYVDTTADCDQYDIIYCGAKTASVLRQEYDTNGASSANGSTVAHSDIQAFYKAMGISRSDLNIQPVMGVVYQNGNVTVNGKVVAKNAMMGARNLGGTSLVSGSTAKKVSVSKMGSAQEALIFLDPTTGAFKFAVMTPCGNPVVATNTVVVPTYACDSITADRITRTEWKFTTKGTATGGAKVVDYIYNFDGADTINANNPVSHVFENLTTDKSHTVKVTPRYMVNGHLVKANTCSTTFTVPGESHPSIDIVKTVNGQKDATIEVGKQFTYTLKVTNTGDVALANDYVSDTAPAGITFVSADKGTITDGKNFSYNVSSLAAGASFTVNITATMNEYVSGTITNKACVDTSTLPGTPDDCDTANVETPRISIVKTVDGQKNEAVKVGDLFEYEIKVTNTGSVDLKNVVVSDTAPTGITFRSTNLGTISNNTLTYTVTSLAVGDSINIKVNAVADQAFTGSKVNTACVDTSTISGTPDDCDTATVTTKIQVCDTDNNTIVWINKDDESNSNYTTDLTQCADVQVCNPSTGNIETVAKSDEDKYESIDSDSCKVKVCNPNTGNIITVSKDDESKYEDVNSDSCKTTATELPHTGIADTIGSVLGLSSITAATYYYVVSRRN